MNEINLTQETWSLAEPLKQCCIYNICYPCMLRAATNPIIFLHGHSFNKNNPPESSINTFSKIQRKLSDEGVIINAGDIDYTSVNQGVWSQMVPPIGVRATYYYISYYDAESLTKSIQKEESIESYSIRLKELIELVLLQTRAEKVVIVAHSMGGLVTQNYMMLFGEDKVSELILIGTPNKGVAGNIEKLCGYFGSKRSCRDLSSESVILKKLAQYTPSVPIKVIVGRGCDTAGADGDGVVQVQSAELSYANMTYIDGTCEDFSGISLHNDLLDQEKYPQVYDTLKLWLAYR